MRFVLSMESILTHGSIWPLWKRRVLRFEAHVPHGLVLVIFLLAQDLDDVLQVLLQTQTPAPFHSFTFFKDK